LTKGLGEKGYSSGSVLLSALSENNEENQFTKPIISSWMAVLLLLCRI
jgi:hypothetical protein